MERMRLGVGVCLLLAAWGCSCVDEDPEKNDVLGPVVASLEPTQGPAAGGTVLLLKGERFSPEAKVTFAGQPASSVMVADPFTMTVVTPAGIEGPADVEVRNPDDSSSKLAAGFRYVGGDGVAPAITAVLPAQGPAAGGSMVEIHGTGFAEGIRAFVGGRPARALTLVSPETVTLVTPAGAVGPAEVALTNSDGRSARAAAAYSFYESAERERPSLVAVVPAQGSTAGLEGAEITGTGFVPNLRVYLGGKPVSGLAFDAGRVSFKTPPGRPGVVDVFVTNPDGQSDSLPGGYNYFTPAALLSRVEPQYGPAEGGTAITILGRNFVPDAAVTLGGKPVTDLEWVDAQTLRGKTPAVASWGWKDLQIVLPGAIKDVLPNAFFFTDADHPFGGGGKPISIARIFPSTAPSTGGTLASLLGAGFQAGAQVTVGSAPATEVRVLGPSSISLKLPPGEVGPAAIEVVNPDGGKARLAGQFSYYDAQSPTAGPQVSGVNPAMGPVGGGTRAVVFGSAFDPKARVFFGTAESTRVLRVSATQLVADAPAYGEPGAVDLTVLNPDGKSSSLPSGFAYYQPSSSQPSPQVNAVTPNKGPAGSETEVVISGRNFQPGAAVYAGMAPAVTASVTSGDELSARLPAQRESKVALVVVNPDGMVGALDAAFEYLVPQVAVLAVEPAEGPARGGTVVTLVGKSFQSGAAVFFGESPCIGVEVEDAQTLSCATPPGEDGPVDVKVVNPDGKESVLAGGFTFRAAPMIAQVEPASGPAGGGTRITLTGSRFREGVAVSVGRLPCGNLNRIDEGQLSCQTPAGAAGPATVTVTNPDGQQGELANGFTFLPPISLVRALPATGPDTGGITVNLLGDGFQDGLTVKVGGTAASQVAVLGATSLSFRLPPGQKGLATVEISHPAQGSASLPGAFSYYDVKSAAAAPTLSKIVPSTGPLAGGTRALIEGASFAGGARVFFGGSPSPYVKVLGGGQILAVTPAVTSPGTVGVLVVNPDGRSDSLIPGFAFYQPSEDQASPKPASVEPAQASAKSPTEILVAGEGFQEGAVVFAGDWPAREVKVASATELTALAPPQGEGFVDVTVTNPDGMSGTLSAGLEYVVPAPKVGGVRPQRGPTAGGISVVVLGEGFERGATVSFGRTLCPEVRFVDSTALRVTVPAELAGKVDVFVTNPDGQVAALSEAFEYDEAWKAGPKPAVAAVQPPKGPSTGGSAVLVRGDGFVEGSSVWFAESPAAQVRLIDERTLYAVTPAVSAGPAHVAVINPDGQSAVLPAGYTFVDPASLGPKPTITGLTPSSGKETSSTEVILTGRNFRSGAFVYFGGVPAANPLMYSGTIYQAEAPPHAPGTVDVAITNADGTSAIASAAFAYVPKPGLVALTPDNGPTSGGTKVLVTGEGFQGGARLSVGGAPASGVVVRSATLLEATTPPGEAGDAEVVVTNPDGQTFALEQGFRFVPPPALDEVPVEPLTGPASGGTRVKISGGGFQEGITVTFAGKPAVATRLDEETLIADTPSASVGYADVVVKNPDGQLATATRAFLYKDPAGLPPAPVLSASAPILPPKGPITGGTLVTLSGGRFQDGAVVFVGSRPATGVRRVAADTLTALTPEAGQPGKVDVVVINPDGQAARAADAFEYLDPEGLDPAPAITALLPSEASIFGDSVIAVAGANLVAGAQFFFEGRPAPSAVVSSGSAATVTAPTGEPGPATVAVTNPDGQTAYYKGLFSFVVPPPRPMVVNPNTGTSRGGTAVTISGNSFQSGATVQIAGGPCANAKVLDAKRIECTTPPGVDGAATVKVTNADGQSGSLTNGFTYVAPPDPQKVSPTSGPETGGTQLSITGAFFREGASVKVGTKACEELQRVSAALLVCKAPPGAPGPAAITVTNSDGQSGTLAAGFTYLPPVPAPKVSNVSPPSGSKRGGTSVTVTGQAFQAGAAVHFGAAPASDVEVISANYLTCLSPPGSVGKVDLTVTNPDGQSAGLTAAFEYLEDAALPALALTTVTPNTGGVDGGTQVVLAGNGFQTNAAVTFGGRPCQDVSRLGPTALTCRTPAAGGPGKVDVVVTNPLGAQATLAGGFTYDLGGRYVESGHQLPMESSGSKRAALLVDVDKDSDLDLFQMVGGAAAWLQINDGAGKFSWAQGNLPSPAGQEANFKSLRRADIDRDGDTDVLYVTDREVVVYRNDGGGKFVRNGYRACWNQWNQDHGGITGFDLGDFNGDGYLDAVISRWTGAGGCWNGSTYVGAGGGELIMQNDKSGGFARRDDALPQVDDNSVATRAADFDRDGDLDVVVVNDSNHQNRLYYNDGTGRFTDVSLQLLGTSGGTGTDVAVGDVDRNGAPDIYVANSGLRNRLYINDGAGRFTDVTLSNRIPDDVDVTWNAWMADYDNDGDLDVLTRRQPTTGFPHYLRVYRNNGSGTFGADVANAVLPANLGETLHDVAFGDLNKDGYVDMVWMQEGFQNRVLLNDTAGKFYRRTLINLPEENVSNTDAVSADFDGDGDADLAVCGTGPQRPKLFLNDGAGNLVDYTAARMPSFVVTCYDIDAVDVNGDGARDLVLSSRSDPGVTPSKAGGPSVYLLLNDGLGAFTDVTFPRLPTDGGNRSLYPLTQEPIDFDGDGDLDLVVGNSVCHSSGDRLRLWENVGSNTGYFADVSAVANLVVTASCRWDPGPGSTWDIQVGDLDGDGKPDLFLSRVAADWCCYASSRNSIFLNKGDGSFVDVTATKLASPTGGKRSVLRDFDGDGDLDIYLVNDGDDRLLLNTGGALYSDVTPSNLPRQGTSTAALVVDVDKNGTPDLVVTKTDRARPRLLVNQGFAVFSDLTEAKMPSTSDAGQSMAKADLDKDGHDDLVFLVSGQSRVFMRKP